MRTPSSSPFLGLIATLGAVVACNGPDDPVLRAQVPEIAVTPSALDFEGAVVPLVSEDAVRIANAGRAPLEIQARIEGDDLRPWSLPVTEATLAAGEDLPLPVRFQPATYLPFSADLVITSNDEDTPEVRVPLSGEGIAGPVPDILVDPPSMDFGTASSSQVAVIQVRNAGQAPLTLGTIAQQGSGRFRIDPDPSGTTIAPGNTLPVVVYWDPADGETGDDGILTVPSDDPDEPEVDVLLIGNGGSDLQWPQAVVDCPATTDPPGFVSLDGRDSTDPEGHLPLTYRWRLVGVPTDSTGQSTSSGYLTSPGAAVTDLFTDAVGDYQVELVVENAIGLVSAPARCTIEAIPDEDLAVELTWNTARADLDLHLARNDATLFSGADDVSYCNKRPGWGVSGTADDPELELDDRAGLGPENINLPAPADSAYTARVHYFDDKGDNIVTATVRVYIEGVQAFEASRNLSRNEVWDVARIAWPAKTVGALAVDPYDAPRRVCP